MEKLLSGSQHQGKPLIYAKNSYLYLIASQSYWPTYWVASHREDMPGIMTRQFVKGLHHKTVYKILISLSGKSAYGTGRDNEGMQQKLVQLILNKRIKVYKLSATHYAKTLMDQNNVLITNARTIDRVTHRSAENLLEKQLKLNLELCLILSARWKEKIRMDDQFWALAWDNRLTVVSGGALNTIVESIVGLAKLGAVVIEGLYDASLYQLKIIGQLSQGEFAQVQRELTKLGVDAASDVDALQQQIKEGYAIIEPLLEDDKSRKILMDFLSGYVDSIPYVEKGAFAVSIPLEVLIALASMGAGAVVSASGAIRRVGQFSGRSLELILDLSKSLKLFKKRLIVEANSPNVIPIRPKQPKVTSAGSDGKIGPKATTSSTTTYNVIELKPGEKGGWNKELNGKLKPNQKYKVGNYLYETDDMGRVTKVSGKLDLNTRDRNQYQQTKSGKADGIKDGLSDDDGGHLVASIFDGAGEQINYAPMNSNLNRGAWKSMENKWASALQNGKEVKVDIRPVYDGNSNRPTKFIARYWIDGEPQKAIFKNVPTGG